MNIKSQRGASIFVWLGMLALAAGVLTLALRLGPRYMEFQTIDTVLTGMKTQDVHGMRKAEIRETLKKRFQINSINDLNVSQIMDIERTRATTTIAVDYEVREPMAYNVDAVVKFKKDYVYK